MLFALSIKIDIFNLEINKLVYLVFGMLYLSTLFIIGGIEKEQHIVSDSVLLFGLITQTIYIIYLYVLNVSIYKYVIYLFVIILLILIDKLILRKKGNQNYTIKILILCLYFAMFTMKKTVIITILATLLIVATKYLIISCKKNKNSILDKSKNKKMPIGFYLCVSNIVVLILQNYIIY